MSTLTFADTHNMVAFLENPAESDGFYEIIDILNATQICYALTVNPTIYTSCIEQFWATAKVKTVNRERGTDCLPTDTIFEELARMRYEKPSPKLTFYKAFFSPQWKFLIHTITQCLSAKTTAWNEFSSTMASAIICLATNQKFNLSKYIFDAMKKQSRRKQRKDIEVSQYSASTEPMTEKETNEESVPTYSYDPSQSGEDRMQLHELMNLCTKLSDRVLALETTKTTQALEIANLKSREDACKHGRSIKDINKVAEVSLVDETQGRSDDTEMFNTDALIGDVVFAENDMTKKEHYVIPKEVSAAETLTTACIKIPVSTAAPSTTVVYAGETATRTPTSVSSLSIKDKGKAKMIEPEEQEQGELTIEEKSKLFMELMNERKRHFAKLRAEEKRRKPLTKGQRRNQMCTYLKNMGGFTHNQLKNKSYEEIKKAFDKIMDWINNFKPTDSKEVKSSKKKAEGSKKKSIDKHEEAEGDDEAEKKKHMEIGILSLDKS
ncbi:hypothetical protein Tco_0010714 [Tanacetum coccineum]